MAVCYIMMTSTILLIRHSIPQNPSLPLIISWMISVNLPFAIRKEGETRHKLAMIVCYNETKIVCYIKFWQAVPGAGACVKFSVCETFTIWLNSTNYI